MKSFYRLLILLAVWLTVASCEHKELCYDHDSHAHYVRVYVDEVLLNVTHGFYNDSYVRPHYSSPQILRLILADPYTGQAVAERCLRNIGKESRGTYYDGYIVAAPGIYTLLAYNFDTETTVVTGYTNFFTAKAYTNEIASHLRTRIPSRAGSNADYNERITYEPDHLFAANCGDVIVPPHDDDILDTLKTSEGDHFTAHSVVRSYYLQIHVQGMEYATSSVGLLTGMSGSSWINGEGMDYDDNVTVFFEMQPGENEAIGILRQSDGKSAVTLYTTFSTFGKLPDAENDLEITFDFLTTYGKPYSETINITDMFMTEEAREKQWLLIDHTIKIPDPPPGQEGGSGFTPGIDDWQDIETDLII